MPSLKPHRFWMKRMCLARCHLPRQYYALVSQVDSNILNCDFGATSGSLNSGEGLYEITGISIRTTTCPSCSTVPTLVLLIRWWWKQWLRWLPYPRWSDLPEGCRWCPDRYRSSSPDHRGVRAMYQGDLIIGRLAMGSGTLNPAAIELQAAAWWEVDRCLNLLIVVLVWLIPLHKIRFVPSKLVV